MKTIRKYGKSPHNTGLLHGGPGAAGEMKPVAEILSGDFGMIEFIQTEKSVDGQIEELRGQITLHADLPMTLIGYSWGAWLGFLLAARHPCLLKKLILISAGAFEKQYSNQLADIRLSRLSPQQRTEAEKLISRINSGVSENHVLKHFGRLTAIADSYDYEPSGNERIDLNIEIFQAVWTEASRLRDSGELIKCAAGINIPVVAVHGDYDPHPIEGVEKPLSENLTDFKMIRIEKCGHIPWKERQAKESFFEMMRKEINTPA